MSDEAIRVIRAAYTAETVTAYQAYAVQIANAAVRAGTFVPPFSRDRMTWIKPSFGWMMHRSGWAAKPGQERVLAIEITRGAAPKPLLDIMYIIGTEADRVTPRVKAYNAAGLPRRGRELQRPGADQLRGSLSGSEHPVRSPSRTGTQFQNMRPCGRWAWPCG